MEKVSYKQGFRNSYKVRDSEMCNECKTAYST